MLLCVGNTLKCCNTFPAGSLTERASSFNALAGCSVFPSDGLTERASSCNILKLCSIFLQMV